MSTVRAPRLSEREVEDRLAVVERRLVALRRGEAAALAEYRAVAARYFARGVEREMVDAETALHRARRAVARAEAAADHWRALLPA